MNFNEKYQKHFQETIKAGESILSECDWDGQDYAGNKYPSTLKYHEWYVSAQNLIEKVCGRNSLHDKQMEESYKRENESTYALPTCLGVFKAAYKDWESGLLDDTKSLITAEVFSNFIEQAEYLMEEGYRIPAAVLMRAVLDDGLRTLCVKNGITLPKNQKIEWMNVELTKANVFNKNVQKQVTAWAGVGNSAAHGKPDEFTDDDVKIMINGIVSFNATYLK